MPDKRPPNAESTQFRSGEEAVENGRKGGIASGKARRENKTIQKILTDYLGKKIKTVKALEKAASSAGITSDASIKELVTTIYLLNSIKKGGLDDLAKLAALIGESGDSNERNALDRLCDALKGVNDG